MEKRSWRHYGWLVLKGIGMGAADVVPGVSGGTIAFLVGIYEELIDSIKSVDGCALKLFFTGKWAAFWKKVNGNFLLALVTGIAISIFSLARLITYLLTYHPVLVWAFFFGLVLASTYFVSKRIRKWNYWKVLLFGIGAGVAFWITSATPSQTPDNLLFIFLCGAVAICAMILPGISGSFILLLLGKYQYVMEAVKTLDLPVMAVFVAGAAIGLVLFSKVLSYLLHRHYDGTVAILAGFMLGSLNKVWPWKTAGLQGLEVNCAPNSLVVESVALMLVGYLLVYVIEKISAKAEAKSDR